MKRRYQKLLSVLGAVAIVVPFAGCEADAEETDAGTNNPAASESGVGAGISTNTTGVAAEAGGTNTVVNQQTTIINRIPPTLPPDIQLSKGVQEVVKLMQSGVSETVVLLFVEKSAESFELDAADIVYLNDIGIPSTVLAAMLNHDGQNPDILHDALNTNSVAVATAPTSSPQQPAVTQAAPPVEVSSNYVAAPQYGGTVVAQDPYDPNAQPQLVEQQPVVVQQPAVVVQQPAVTYSYFYSSLSPYGSWVEVPDYGWCWQPTIAVTHRGWRPYTHGGRWLHSDAGWYWHSDYSWGWAPFHYGRWYSAPRAGWVWVPDYTWGPSWVTWRRGPDYCGWAPLPPRSYVRPGIGFSYWGRDVGFNFSFGYSHDYYTFVPTSRFCDRRIIDHVVPTHRVRNVYHNSTVVNNYIVGNNNTIINNGVGRDYVASHTRNEIPRVRVQEAPTSGSGVQPDRLHRRGNETFVYRPQRPSPTLVKAHETAVARRSSETGRQLGNSLVETETRGTITPNRPGRSEPLAASVRGSETARAANSRGGAVPITRNETARPQIASRGGSEVPAPVFGTPAPIRPEPDRSAEVVRASRASQEARVRPSSAGVNAPVRGGGLVSTSPTGRPETIRPGIPARGVAPRLTPNTGNITTQPDSTQTTRPGVITTHPSGIPRGGISRATPAAPATPVPRGGESARPTTASPGRTDLGNSPAASPSFTRPNVAAQSRSVTAAQVVRPSQPGAQSPAFARPAPSAAQPATPIVRGGGSNPNWSQPQAVPRGGITTSPQPIQRQAPAVQAPAPAARPSPIQRSESFSRPPSAVRQSAPAPTVVHPRGVSPLPSQQRPSFSPRPQAGSPSVSAPPVRSAPNVNVSSAPIRGGNFRSAPPAAAAGPSVTRPERGGGQSSGNRGRVEIGR